MKGYSDFASEFQTQTLGGKRPRHTQCLFEELYADPDGRDRQQKTQLPLADYDVDDEQPDKGIDELRRHFQ